MIAAVPASPSKDRTITILPGSGDGAPLRVEIVRAGGAPEVRAAGEVDLDSAPRLRAALEDAAADGAGVRLHLRAVDFIDSSGIRLLVETDRDVAPHRLVLVAPSPEVRRVLAISRLDRRFVVEDAPG